MVDKIVELENNRKYLILDCENVNNINYYYGIRLDKDEKLTNNYLFFREVKNGNDTYLLPINDEKIKGMLLTTFTINYLDKIYDIGGIKE